MIEASRFEDRLALGVTLTIAGTAYVLPGGSVKLLELELEQHGFVGALEFVVLDDSAYGGGFSDTLVDAFLDLDLGKVEISVSAVFDAPEAATSPEPLSVTGLVTSRSLRETQLRTHPDLPIVARRYRIELADPARVLWAQHFPCRLYTEASLEDVVNDQLGDEITMSYDWAELAEKRSMLFVHLPVEHEASFYDFVLWYADRRGGYFGYDYSAAEYTLKGARDASGDALGLFGDDLAEVELRVPAPPRHAVAVCNSYAEAPTTGDVTQDQAATGIRHDLLLRSAIAQVAEDRVTLETNRLILPKYEAKVTFARVPIVALAPGVLVELVAANRWASRSAMIGKTWLVRSLRLRAEAPAAPLDHDLEIDDTTYAIELGAELQQSDDTRPVLPSHRRPSYPGLVEGKVVSTLGEDGEKTYESLRNEDTSLDEYVVEVPLWGDQQIKVPFSPLMGSGNVYLPCYRDERVLLALDLDHARIDRLLVWREGAALSKDVQGEQILWGKSATSNTAVNHVYEDQIPVFKLARTHESDTVLISLSEGNLKLHVEEQKSEK